MGAAAALKSRRKERDIMARGGDSLAYEMKAAALGEKSRNPNQSITDRDTIHSYKSSINRFCAWAKEEGYSKEQILSSPREHLQEYANHLVEQGLSKSTVHTYVAAPCKGLGVPMQHISKPQRSADDITRSRGGRNPQGQREMQDSRFERLVAFQEVTGLRRAELKDLKGEDLRIIDGKMYVVARQGKGGKEQWQRILPKDSETVQRTFDGVKKDQYVFDDREMKNKIDLHGIRAEHAKECYDYYVARIKEDPAYREQLKEDLKDYFKEHHDPGRDLDLKAYERFCNDLEKNQGMYQMRGESRKLAEEHERPTDYDRVALMAVSVEHLAHWRLDVTVINYLT